MSEDPPVRRGSRWVRVAILLFAGVALRIDFVNNFDLAIVLIVLVVAMVLSVMVSVLLILLGS